MGRNRLAELQSASKHAPVTEEEEMAPLRNKEAEDKKRKDKRGKAGGDDHDPFEDFMERFQVVASQIDAVGANSEEIRTVQKRLLSAAHRDEKAEGRMDDLIEENKRAAKAVRAAIEKERVRVAAMKTKPPKPMTNQFATELRMRDTQVQAQSRRFYSVWNDFNKDQMEYRDKTKKRLAKKVKVTNSRLTEEQIEEMLDEGHTDVFAKSILDEERLARQQLTELQDRHDDLIKLERSVQEVHDMFLDIATLVQDQGEIVDNIARHVEEAQMDVERGKGHLQKAENWARAARKKKVICFIILAVVLFIVLLVVLIEFGIL